MFCSDAKIYTIFGNSKQTGECVNMLNEASNKAETVKRKQWVDALRALAIIIVLLVHSSRECENWYIYNVFIGPIMIPMFFAISGYLFNIREAKQLPFFKNLFFKMILPWFVLSLVWARAVLIPFKGFTPYYTEQLWNFISGKTVWYLPCCIIAEIIQF